MPTRIQRRRTRGWRMPSGAVYVGRGSRWGNPYRVARVGGGYVVEGPDWCSSHESRVEAHQVAVDRYRVWVVHQSGFVDQARGRWAVGGGEGVARTGGLVLVAAMWGRGPTGARRTGVGARRIRWRWIGTACGWCTSLGLSTRRVPGWRAVIWRAGVRLGCRAMRMCC